MASAEAALVALLTTGSPNPVADLVAARVYPDALPLGVLYPAIRYQRISTARFQYRKIATGTGDYAKPRFQIDCFAATKAGALALSDAVRAQLDGYSGISATVSIGSAALEDEASDIEQGAGTGGSNIFRHRLDYLIGHAE